MYFSSTLRENGSGPTEVGVGMAVVREEELEDTDLFESGFDKLHFDINKVKLLSIERRRESMSWITVSVPFCREFETSVPTTSRKFSPTVADDVDGTDEDSSTEGGC